MLEKAGHVGAIWRRHYDRLHLHTDRNHSGLPGMAMPPDYPAYPSREQVVAYLETYAAHFEIKPTFNATVSRFAATVRIGAPTRRRVGSPRPWLSWRPASPTHPIVRHGRDRTAYSGQRIHSSEYGNPAPYAGKRVLVVGFGNSGGEIALDLANAGVDVALAVRGPVQILPRDLLGFPILSWAILYRRLPARLVDFINAPVIRLAVGNIEKLGLRRAAKGPRQMVEEDGRVPLIDIGTLAKIRDGSIKLRGGIDRFTPDGVVFADARAEAFDEVILATGFRPDLRRLMPDVAGVFDQHGMPLVTGRATAAPGLYFCGQITVPTGQLREIGIEAQRIADSAMACARRFPLPQDLRRAQPIWNLDCNLAAWYGLRHSG